MRGIGELLLFDESVFVQPVEELRPVGADHLGLRIVDVRVDEARQYETAGLIVDDAPCGRAGKNVARLADRLDQAAIDEHGSVFDEGISARAALSADRR